MRPRAARSNVKYIRSVFAGIISASGSKLIFSRSLASEGKDCSTPPTIPRSAKRFRATRRVFISRSATGLCYAFEIILRPDLVELHRQRKNRQSFQVEIARLRVASE